VIQIGGDSFQHAHHPQPAEPNELHLDLGKDSGLCLIRHKPDHVGLWIMSDSCALSLSRPTSAGVWTLSNPT
jgi:hypothetical protein